MTGSVRKQSCETTRFSRRELLQSAGFLVAGSELPALLTATGAKLRIRVPQGRPVRSVFLLRAGESLPTGIAGWLLGCDRSAGF